jgi:hypothetical protein
MVVSAMHNEDKWLGCGSSSTEILPFLNGVNFLNVLVQLSVSLQVHIQELCVFMVVFPSFT